MAWGLLLETIFPGREPVAQRSKGSLKGAADTFPAGNPDYVALVCKFLRIRGVEMLVERLVFLIRVPGFEIWLHFQFHLHANIQTVGDGSGGWVPAGPVGDPDGLLGSWISPSINPRLL